MLRLAVTIVGKVAELSAGTKTDFDNLDFRQSAKQNQSAI